MLITLGFYKRRPGTSVEEFRHVWSTVYGPLFSKRPEDNAANAIWAPASSRRTRSGRLSAYPHFAFTDESLDR